MDTKAFKIGSDISRARQELIGKLEIYKSKEFVFCIYTWLEILFKDSPPEDVGYIFYDDIMNKDDDGIITSFYLHFFIFLPLLKIKQLKYDVGLMLVVFVEVVYGLSNLNWDLKKDAGSLGRDWSAVLKWATNRASEFAFRNSSPVENDEAFNTRIHELEKLYCQAETDHPEFDYIFAVTLRQTSLTNIKGFLNHQAKYFDSMSEFVEFLECIILEHSDIIPEKNIIMSKTWIDKVEKEVDIKSYKTGSSEIQASNTIVFSENNLTKKKFSSDNVEEISNAPFIDPDFPFKRIQIRNLILKETPKVIRRFLSFISTETNGGAHPFSKDAKLISYLNKYGLIVPESPLDHRFTLDLVDKNRSQKVFLTIVYRFHRKYGIDKSLMVRWLKSTFTNFDNRGKGSRPYNFLKNGEFQSSNQKFEKNLHKYI